MQVRAKEKGLVVARGGSRAKWFMQVEHMHGRKPNRPCMWALFDDVLVSLDNWAFDKMDLDFRQK